MMIVQHLAMGDPITQVCACGAEQTVYPIWALDIDGVLLLAEITECLACGRAWRCRLCAAVLAADGDLAHRHVAEVHAG